MHGSTRHKTNKTNTRPSSLTFPLPQILPLQRTAGHPTSSGQHGVLVPSTDQPKEIRLRHVPVNQKEKSWSSKNIKHKNKRRVVKLNSTPTSPLVCFSSSVHSTPPPQVLPPTPVFTHNVRFQRFLQQGVPHVQSQRRALAHGKHTGFGAGVVDHGGNVPARKNVRRVGALQIVVHGNKTPLVQRQPRLLQPAQK
jgi:hypothetical protein